ncbi:MAG: hypothetical protein R3E84_19110 [Pseudomonadales bacterium]
MTRAAFTRGGGEDATQVTGLARDLAVRATQLETVGDVLVHGGQRMDCP